MKLRDYDERSPNLKRIHKKLRDENPEKYTDELAQAYFWALTKHRGVMFFAGCVIAFEAFVTVVTILAASQGVFHECG